MITADTVHTNNHKRRRRFKGYRRIKVVLLALGLAGLALGFSLAGGYLFHGNVKLLKIGVIYVLVSMVVLGLRGIMIYVVRLDKDE